MDKFHESLLSDDVTSIKALTADRFDAPYSFYSKEYYPLMTCIYNFSHKCATYMISNGCDLDVRNCYGSTPLHVACYCRNFEAVKLLVQHGCDTNVQDKWGKTPIFHAAHFNDLETVTYLFDKCDTSIRSNSGKTVFEYNNVDEKMHEHLKNLAATP